LADICLELGKRKEALLNYKKAISLDPSLEDIAKKLKENFSEQEIGDIEVAVKPLPFWQNLGEVIKYPLAKQGTIIIIIGSIVFAFLSAVPIAGALLTLIIYVYILAYMMKVLESNISGKKDLPDWPSDIWEQITRPFVQVISTSIASAFPAIIFFIIFLFSGRGPVAFILYLFFIFLGSIYFPMGLIAVAVYDNTLASFNYAFLLRSIWKIKKHYMLSLISMWIFAFVGAIVSSIFVPAIPLIGQFIFWVITLYFVIVQMHILGNVYYINKHILKWF
jgi:hypothetical protein